MHRLVWIMENSRDFNSCKAKQQGVTRWAPAAEVEFLKHFGSQRHKLFCSHKINWFICNFSMLNETE